MLGQYRFAFVVELNVALDDLSSELNISIDHRSILQMIVQPFLEFVSSLRNIQVIAATNFEYFVCINWIT